MRPISTVAAFSMLPLATASTDGNQAIDVTIDKIVANDQITGKVGGLTSAGQQAHKVLVYVKTDEWYIHPYAQGGEGKSWASISDDGTWSIETVLRAVPATSIAALVVAKDSTAPSKVSNVRAIPHQAIIVKKLEGTPDYGKV